MHILKTIYIGLMVTLATFFQTHPNANPATYFGGSFQTGEVRALFETTLASRITSSATSFTLTSAADKDGTSLASSTYGFIIDEGTSVEEMVLADCTGTTCTNVTRGLSVRTGTTTVAALQFAHNRGASVKITDGPSLVFATNVFKGKQNIENPLLYASTVSNSTSSNQVASVPFVNGAANIASTSAYNKITTSDNTYTGTTTYSGRGGIVLAYGPSNANDAANKAYVDAISIAGVSDADSTTKGIVEEATAAEVSAGTATGGTGARLYVNPSVFASSDLETANYFAATTSVAIDTNGRITPATTTSITSGKSIMIWAACSVDESTATTFYLDVGNPGGGTTTLSSAIQNGGGSDRGGQMLMGVYTSTTTGKMNIAIDETQFTGVATHCFDSKIMYIRFN